ncbi:MAG TPA: hypothetical protein VGF35_01640 [Steroidobacteraceae bacterium]
MSEAAAPATEEVLFEGGPPHKLQSLLGLIGQNRPRLLGALMLVLIVWVPLAVLSLWHGDFFDRATGAGFASDFAAHARFLLAAPLLVLAEAVCLPQLTAIAWQFMATGIVAEPQYPRFREAVASTRRLMNSTAAEIGVLLLAYALVGALLLKKPPGEFTPWHGALVDGHFLVAPAGWWLLLVSLPLLVVLMLGWAWRLLLWGRFLLLMNRLPLRLIPAHPDQAAGLKFVGYALRAFVPLGFITGILAVGPMLNDVVHRAASPLHYKFTVAGVAVAVLVIFVLPLLAFSQRLIAERRRGIFLYGALASTMGREFEKRWFASGRQLDEDALSAVDFSATTDLYAVAANAYAIRTVPLELRDLAVLVLATLLPFVPLLLLVAPLDVILDKLAGLLL